MDPIYKTMLRDEVWKAFSDGGELQWIRDPVLLTHLANLYGTLMDKSIRHRTNSGIAVALQKSIFEDA